MNLSLDTIMYGADNRVYRIGKSDHKRPKWFVFWTTDRGTIDHYEMASREAAIQFISARRFNGR